MKTEIIKNYCYMYFTHCGTVLMDRHALWMNIMYVIIAVVVVL